jgi:hypothetical protein
VSGPEPISQWWGSFDVPMGQAGRFRVGPVALWVQRRPHEWRVRSEHADGSEHIISVEVPASIERAKGSGRSATWIGYRRDGEPVHHVESTDTSVQRYATASDTTRLRLVPVLPDRMVVTRPEKPLTILPRTKVTLYVGSPVWARLLQGEDEALGDVPLSPPKEAWLGPSTREGELCYATRTYGRLALDEIVLSPHRVMTAVTIENRIEQPFVCEQVNLPVRRLSVYATAGGRLWTEAVTLERVGELAKLILDDQPPRVASEATRISGPRDVADAGMFRAFGTLFR